MDNLSSLNSSGPLKKGSTTKIVVGVILAALGCLGLACVGIALALFLNFSNKASTRTETTPVPLRASTLAPAIYSATQNPPTTISPEQMAGARQTLDVLQNTVVPENDPISLAERFLKIGSIQQTVQAPSRPYTKGDTLDFWVSNTQTNTTVKVQAVMAESSQHLYFWVQKGVTYDQSVLNDLVDAFENHIYPTDRRVFGSEWLPGVDNDPHLHILYARGLGGSTAGYFSSADEYPPQAHKYSNAKEMFVVSADLVDLKDSYIRSTLAHEFQHMIHWHLDRNEQAWLNEGFSELATILNGYDPGGFENSYIFNPDIQLNDWPADQSQTPAHYGAGYLFTAYFLDRFGEKATQDLIKEPVNGMASVDQVLTDIGAKSPIDGKAMTSVDFFQDWTIANYLADKQIYNEVYSYHNIKAPIAAQTQIEQNCGSGAWHTASVHQFGVDYIQFNCGQSSTLDFEGATGAIVMPTDPKSGQYYYWSNRGDQSNSTLQREFDLTDAGGKIVLNYWTWYDVEQDYDFVYVSASSNGVDWVQLKPALCSSDNKTGNNYGCGYTGSSEGWQADSVNLDQFAGQKVTVRFDYVTDAAVNGRGFLLDDVSLSTGGYRTDFEQADSSWQANGFVRIQNNLPQTYALALIKEKGGATTITRVSLDEMQKGSVKLEPGVRYTLVVSATEGFTNDQAGYRYATH